VPFRTLRLATRLFFLAAAAALVAAIVWLLLDSLGKVRS
jgi:hypothetical protein